MSLLGTCDVIQNGGQDGHHLGEDLSNTAENEIFFLCRYVKYDMIKHAFVDIKCFFPSKTGKKYAFLYKNGLTSCYL